uniref:Uncharacterized protein n=1 Tax=Medicago truncatula TaxID=3880 RepID=I3S7M4_MEDTR|nr:unknown [Medicago truncatula]
MLSFIISHNIHNISPNFLLLLHFLTKEFLSNRFNPLPTFKRSSMIDHLEEPPFLACTSYFPHKLINN